MATRRLSGATKSKALKANDNEVDKMEFWGSILDTFFVLLKYMFVLSFVVDNCLIYYANKSNMPFLNKYYQFHISKGLLKITALKTIAALFVILCFIDLPLDVYDLMAVTVLYCIYVIKMVMDFIKSYFSWDKSGVKEQDEGVAH